MHKMLQISKEEYEKCFKLRYFWVNIKDLELESDVANWTQIFDECDPKKNKIQT